MASTAVLGPLVLAVVWLGGPAFLALAALVGGLVAWEWLGIVRGRGGDAAGWCAILGTAGFVLLAGFGWWLPAVGVLAAAAVAAQVLARDTDPAGLTWAGLLYAGVPVAALVILRTDPSLGLVAVLFVLLVVWATDTGAYFAGRALGGPKLWPLVSPKKTWSGAFGGIAAAIMVAVGFVVHAAPAQRLVPLAAVAALLSIVAQLGDLAESALKRHFDVKDSSRLIPGHGGVMDRIDGLFAAGLLAAAIGTARGGVHAAGSGLVLW